MFKTSCRVALLAILCTASIALAQADLSAITGTVTDSTGAVIEKASVDVLGVDTGIHYKTQTNNTGIYRINNLHVGYYRITIAKDGFKAVTTSNFEQVAGVVRTFDAHLNVNGSVTTVTVDTELDKSTATIAGTIAPEQVSKVPLNGRSWQGLLALVPGAVDTGGTPGTAGSINYNGGGNGDANYQLDGNDMTGIKDQPTQNNERLQISTEGIKEFNVPVANYTAEDGGTGGAQINIVSKTGTDQMHGSAFEFIRNDKFDARNPLSPVKSPFHLNQFGGSLGGPIVKQKTFYFMTYEGIRQSLGLTQVAEVPTAAYRATLAQEQPALAFLLNAFPLQTAPFYTAGSSTPSNTVGEWVNNTSAPQQEDSGMIRVDHRFNARDSVYVRYNIDQDFEGAPQNLGNVQTENNRLQNFEADYTHIFSESLLNDARFGINRASEPTQEITGLPFSIQTSDFAQVDGTSTKAQASTSFNYRDDLTKQMGRNTVKAGIYIRRIWVNQNWSQSGGANYNGAASLLLNQVNNIQIQAAWPSGLRKTQYFGYVQNEWKVTPELTVNAGLRYNFFQPFSEVHGNSITFDYFACGGYCKPGGLVAFPDYTDFDPRTSVVWAPKRFHGNTVIRTGYGIFHGEDSFSNEEGASQNTVPSVTLSSFGSTVYSWPIPTSALPPPGCGHGDFNFVCLAKTPAGTSENHPAQYFQDWSLSIEQALPARFMATIAYMGSKGTHLFSATDVNRIDPVTHTRPLAAAGFPSQIKENMMTGASAINALRIILNRQLSNGLFLNANYSWSHALNDGSSGAGAQDTAENVDCRERCEWASGDYDVRQTYNVSTVYQLPFGNGKLFSAPNHLLNSVVSGWEISNLISGRTGLPLNVTVNRNANALLDGNNNSQRPDRVPGVSFYLPHRGPNGWLNPAAFSMPANDTWGNLGRNAVRGPGLWQDDVALDKEIPLHEHISFNLRAEAFNVFNRAQYGSPSSKFNTGSFGVITKLVNSQGLIGSGTPRVLQFAGRINF